MADVVIFGAGQIAEVAKVYLDTHGPHRVVGFTVDGAYLGAGTFHDLPVIAWERLEERFPPDEVELIGPLSYRRLNEFRRDRHREGKARGYRFASFIHPAAHVYTKDIGENAFILEANVVQPFARLGEGVILWSGNHVGHHAVIDDYCFLASHVIVGSSAHIGERTFLGAGAAVTPGAEVGAGSFIAAMAGVPPHLEPDSVVQSFEKKASRAKASRLKRLF